MIMKKRNVTVLCMALLLLAGTAMTGCSTAREETDRNTQFGEETSSPKDGGYTYEIYEYPITPKKTPEQWKQLGNHYKKLKACQIPEDILSEMTTRQLLLTCIDYPLAKDEDELNRSDLTFDYFGTIVNKHNGFVELFKRADFSEELAALYKYYTESVSENPEKFDALLNESDPKSLGQDRVDRLSCLFHMTNCAMSDGILNAADIEQIKAYSAELSSKFDKETSEYLYFNHIYELLSGKITVTGSVIQYN